MSVNFVNIPTELKQNASFCLWKKEKRGGRVTKVPYNPSNGTMAKTNDASTFSDFATAMKAYASGLRQNTPMPMMCFSLAGASTMPLGWKAV